MTTARALVVSHTGAMSGLDVRTVPVASPAAGEVQVAVQFAGINFIDVYQRRGEYPLQTPFISCSEGSGTVVQVGDAVSDVALGDRVAWAGEVGSACELVNRPASSLVPVPDEVSLEMAAASLLQGMTAHYLVKATFPVTQHTTCLVHAGAGGVGQLLVQMILRTGSTVIATTGTSSKVPIIQSLGVPDVLNYRDPDFVQHARSLTRGRGFDVVFDGVGRDTFNSSVQTLRPRGMLVLFGASSGPVPPILLDEVLGESSLYLARPSLWDFISEREELTHRASEVFEMVSSDVLKIDIFGKYPLSAAHEAYTALEGHCSSGKLLFAL